MISNRLIDDLTGIMDLSIIICTKDRPHQLKHTLDCLRLQNLSYALSWNIVVVDNSLHGSAHQTVRDQNSFLTASYLRCTEAGVARARNHGVKNTAADIIVFLDDDSYPVGPSWLNALVSAIHSRPDCSFFGGLSILDECLNLPAWLQLNRKKFQFLTAERQSEWVGTDIDKTSLPYSLNLAIVRSRFGPVHFQENLGKGLFLGSTGEETALLSAALRNGQKGMWVKDAVVLHDIGSDRFRFRNLMAAYWGSGRSGFRMRTTSPSVGGEILRFMNHLRIMLWLLFWSPVSFLASNSWRCVTGEWIKQLGMCYESAQATAFKIRVGRKARGNLGS
jgi:GT2 family glycosyltransferase